jgi:hypothetical protein
VVTAIRLLVGAVPQVGRRNTGCGPGGPQ